MGEVKRYAYQGGKMIECAQVPAGVKCFVTGNDYDALRAENAELVAALSTLLRVDDEWHGSVNSKMAMARHAARIALAKHRGDK